MKSAAPPTASRYGARLVWLSFFLLVALPLYAIAVAASIRSSLFRFNGPPLNNEQLKAVWAFLAAGLTTSAAVLGSLLTKSHNDRTLALQSDANERLKLDTVTNVLHLICPDGAYSPKAVTAGGLATLVHLGHPIVAMRTLAAALPDGAVDNDTAAWLISQVLTTTRTTGTPADLAVAKAEAASLLWEYAPKFTGPASGSANFSWPGAVMAQWQPELPQSAAVNILTGMIGLLLSRSKEWWLGEGNTYTWILYTFDEVVLSRDNRFVKVCAATLGLSLLEVTDRDVLIVGIDDARERSKVADDMNSVDRLEEWPLVDALCRRIQEWGQGESSAETPPSEDGDAAQGWLHRVCQRLRRR